MIIKFGFENCLVSSCNFSDMEIRNTDFTGSRIENCDFFQTNLTSSNFTDTVLKDTIFESTNLTKADFTNAKDYRINPAANKLKDAKFTLPEALSFFEYFEIKVKA
jgi:uncharacterized protein YjbI with pentapeptide repeats